MKNRVVLFTQNNARILTNPPDLVKFEGKENAYVNPDLGYVYGVDPHFWTHFPSNNSFSIFDAERVVSAANRAQANPDSDKHKKIFYETLEKKLREAIFEAKDATDKISKLLAKADKVSRLEVIENVKKELVIPKKSKNSPEDPNNQRFRDLCDQFLRGQIVPMLDAERSKRQYEIKLFGTINTVETVSKRPVWFYVSILALAMIVFGFIWWNLK